MMRKNQFGEIKGIYYLEKKNMILQQDTTKIPSKLIRIKIKIFGYYKEKNYLNKKNTTIQ